MLNNKAGIIGIALGICLIAVSLFAYSQVSALQSNVNSKQADNENLNAQVTDLQQQVSSLLQEVNTKTGDLASAQDQITSLSAEIADLHATVAMHEQLLCYFEAANHDLALAHCTPASKPQLM